MYVLKVNSDDDAAVPTAITFLQSVAEFEQVISR